jgi:transposase-like protein
VSPEEREDAVRTSLEIAEKVVSKLAGEFEPLAAQQRHDSAFLASAVVAGLVELTTLMLATAQAAGIEPVEVLDRSQSPELRRMAIETVQIQIAAVRRAYGASSARRSQVEEAIDLFAAREAGHQ